jgi:uncharacterized protein YjbI with pentapeptide repeats
VEILANSVHVEIVKRGTRAIAAWRKVHPAETLDLAGAILRVANLQKAKLEGANLRGAILRGANLQEAELGGAKLQVVEIGFHVSKLRSHFPGTVTTFEGFALARLIRAIHFR